MTKKRNKNLIMLAATLVASITFVSHVVATKVSLTHGRKIIGDLNDLITDLEALDNPHALDGVPVDISSLYNAMQLVENDIKNTVSKAQALLQ
jgi:hypothetical protein